eukprot:Nk52_evm2s704 gene=Nk52_evmTU2s704
MNSCGKKKPLRCKKSVSPKYNKPCKRLGGSSSARLVALRNSLACFAPEEKKSDSSHLSDVMVNRFQELCVGDKELLTPYDTPGVTVPGKKKVSFAGIPPVDTTGYAYPVTPDTIIKEDIKAREAEAKPTPKNTLPGKKKVTFAGVPFADSTGYAYPITPDTIVKEDIKAQEAEAKPTPKLLAFDKESERMIQTPLFVEEANPKRSGVPLDKGDAVFKRFCDNSRSVKSLRSIQNRYTRKEPKCLALPEEMLQKIFSYLSAEDRVRVGSVCTQWRDASKANYLWKGDLPLGGFLTAKSLSYDWRSLFLFLKRRQKSENQKQRDLVTFEEICEKYQYRIPENLKEMNEICESFEESESKDNKENREPSHLSLLNIAMKTAEGISKERVPATPTIENIGRSCVNTARCPRCNSPSSLQMEDGVPKQFCSQKNCVNQYIENSTRNTSTGSKGVSDPTKQKKNRQSRSCKEICSKKSKSRLKRL